jgi:uncharacterized repeat protein (TIGR03803 family)
MLSGLVGAVSATYSCCAAIAVLHEFDGENGKTPYGGLVKGASAYFGTTVRGGQFNNGTLYRFDPASNSYTVLHEFSLASGGYPYNHLVATDSEILGAASRGGNGNQGVLYRFRLGSGQYEVLHHFALSVDNGAVPYTSPSLLNGALYGLTYRGGVNDLGSVYRFDLARAEFAVLRSLDVASGCRPFGGVTVVGGWLYGMTSDHLDPAARGTIFRLRPDGSAFEVVHRFGGGASGGYPYDGLTFDGHRKLYGTTLGYYTDLSDEGVLFRFDIETGEYRVLHDFGSMTGDGAKPNGSPVLSWDGATLYCLTHGSEVWGGDEYGTLFSVKTDGSDFKVLHTFSGGYEGDTPMRTPVLEGQVLLGTTAVGGAPQDPVDHWLDGRGYGLIWRFNLSTPPTAAELGNFETIALGGGRVRFWWQMILEVDLIGFLVEHSRDGLQWERCLPRVIPAAGGGRPQSYTIQSDAAYSTPSAHYRLVAVRLNGSEDVIATTKIRRVPFVELERMDGALKVRAVGIPGRVAVLESASDLHNPTWTVLSRQVFDLGGSSVFRLGALRDYGVQFFRVSVMD